MKEGHLRVSIERVEPNPWNPNEMSKARYKKLKLNLQRLLESSSKLPPIIVRPDEEHNCYQIIDGEHRWRAYKELGQERISVFSMRLDESTARILTNNLNYLRGSANREKYAVGLVKLIELGRTTADLADLLPEDADDIDQLLSEVDVTVKAYEELSRTDEGESSITAPDGEYGGIDVWTTVTFRVSVSQARVVEQEVQRIMQGLKGKNKRARALEYMAVQSSQCEVPGDLV